jgi:hypothetical protein
MERLEICLPINWREVTIFLFLKIDYEKRSLFLVLATIKGLFINFHATRMRQAILKILHFFPLQRGKWRQF